MSSHSERGRGVDLLSAPRSGAHQEQQEAAAAVQVHVHLQQGRAQGGPRQPGEQDQQRRLRTGQWCS